MPLSKKLLRWVCKLGLLLFTGAAIGAVCLLAVFYFYGRGLPGYQQLAKYEPPIVSRLYANDGRMFAEYAQEKRIYVPLQGIPLRVQQTFMVAEDKNFYSHFGIDIIGIVRAVFLNLKRRQENKRPTGASTITQQVAKNFLLNEISNELSFSRKIKEAILALRIEMAYTKDYILELYLNEIFLGRKSFGIAAAALNYFNKALDELTIAEAAFLAALPKAPSRYDPVRNPKMAKARRDWVISRMQEEGLITEYDAQRAREQPLLVQQPRNQLEVVKADYFAEELRRRLAQQYGQDALYRDGLVVRTTLNPHLQHIAQTQLRQALMDYDRSHGWRGPVAHISKLADKSNLERNNDWLPLLNQVSSPPGAAPWRMAVVIGLTPNRITIGLKDGSTGEIPFADIKWARKYISQTEKGPVVQRPEEVVTQGDVILVEPLSKMTYSLRQVPKVSGAIVAMEPNTGHVLAMVGGFSFHLSQYNRATQAYRQPGSAVKSLMYLTALEKGFSPLTILEDAPLAIPLGKGLGIWKPQNYDKKFMGPITLRAGLEGSRNTVTIRILQELTGLQSAFELMKKLGVVENGQMNLSIALGTSETTLLNMVNAYAMIANGGLEVKPLMVERIQDRRGKTIWVSDRQQCSGCNQGETWRGQPIPRLIEQRNQILQATSAYQMVSLLEGSFQRSIAKIHKGLVEQMPEGILAGKTGTTQDYRDAWYLGFSPDLVVGVYIGMDEPQTLGHKAYAVQIAAPVFLKFMQEALKQQPARPFRVPEGIRFAKVNRLTGVATDNKDPNMIVEALKITDKINTELPQKEKELNPSKQDTTISGTGGLY